MTITIGWWMLPLALSLVGSGMIWIDNKLEQCPDHFGIGAAMVFVGYVISWGIPWGIYGICRAIWG